MYYYCCTFLCWLFGGWFGLHHFYLGRDSHGFLWANSFGGFIIGWLRECSRLKSYTDDANKTNDQLAMDGEQASVFSNITRIIGMFIFGIFYRRIFFNSIPDDLSPPLLYNVIILLVAPLGTTLATYLISNTGVLKCSFKYPLIGAYIGELLFGHIHIFWGEVNAMLVMLCTVIPTVMYWKQRRVRRNKRSCCNRLLLWSSLGILFCLLWTSNVYYNVELYVDELDQNVKLRVILKDLFDSPEWQDLKKEMKNLLYTLWESGGDYDKTWFLFQEGIATTRIQKALEVFELDHRINIDSEITESVLTKRYHELVIKWHPDKHPPSEKDHAQDMFIQIQESYKILKTVVKRKSKKTEL